MGRHFELHPSNGGKYTINLSHKDNLFHLTINEDGNNIQYITAPHFVNGLIFLAKIPLVGYDGYYSRRYPYEQSAKTKKANHIHAVTRLIGRLVTTNKKPVEDTIFT